MKNKLLITSTAALILTACGASETSNTVQSKTPAKPKAVAVSNAVPADKFDLSHWNITVPVDANNDEKVDIVKIADMKTYSHPDFFYVNEAGDMVFAAPNKALTTPNSSNTRSELRYMSCGSDTKIKTSSPGNNFALKSHPNADEFASIGGRMEATVTVDHVATRAGNPDRPAAYSAVIGQIHSIKDNPQSGAFGFGNEPLKIYFKKYPNHKTGSVFWNYERNLPKEDPDRTDIANPVWGNTWTNTEDPGSEGIPLGQALNYVVNVYGDVMHLEFSTAGKPTKTFKINLADNVDANGKVDPKDNPRGYAGDSHYFKAGIYNQCSTKDAPGIWYAACPGTGDWATDKANGDYAQATFSRLVVTDAKPM
ncbi:polysaccharide lyase family 7 protein [Hellea sp.]|nr:polysaccharide lyase family 7 protein [Hellea sp.]